MDQETKKKLNAAESVPAAESCVTCDSKNCGGCGGSRCNLHSYNWLADIPGGEDECDIVEVHFKNTRRGFYRNSSHLSLKQGDMVAVEANPGHDIGEVAMTGRLVRLQMRRANLRPDAEILRVFRKAKPQDLERYEEAKSRETDTMIRSRKIAVDLGLKMKIGDVEYQGDGNKAIFYYIADERIDFRQLIKVLADVFKIRVEMKQIGARQEAGRIGGIGPCGRPLCCATWMTNFVSVATSAARYQDISLNPQKLAGQCAKLKCCINYEVDTYVESAKAMPSRNVVLETKDKVYYYFKSDVLKREITYSTDKSAPANLVTLPASRVFEVIALNKNGVKPDNLSLNDKSPKDSLIVMGDILEQESINRFDKKKKKKKNNNKAQRGQEKPEQQSQGEAKPREGRREHQDNGREVERQQRRQQVEGADNQHGGRQQRRQQGERRQQGASSKRKDDNSNIQNNDKGKSRQQPQE